MEYLALRQLLKESIRKQVMNQKSSIALANLQDNSNKKNINNNKFPCNEYGSFFGPSKSVMTKRVIQASKSLLKDPNFAAKVFQSNQGNYKALTNGQPRKITNALKTKVERLKYTRDYSFLLSDDDGEFLAPAKDVPPRSMHTLSPSKLQPSISKKVSVQKKEFQGSSKGKIMPKQTVSASKPQVKQPRVFLREERPMKKPTTLSTDDDYDNDGAKAISMIRRMFGYDPNKYRDDDDDDDDDDDTDMVVGFNNILREERRSAMIAKREDEEELCKIEEEQRRERLRREAKKRKLIQ